MAQEPDPIFSISIKMTNDAFTNESMGGNGSEVARILRRLADRVDGTVLVQDGDVEYHPVLDINGATVGTWQVEGDYGYLDDAYDAEH